MKKIIRLTEADLTRLVKRVLKENDEFDVFAQSDYDSPKYRSADDRQTSITDLNKFDEHKTFGPGEYDDFMEYINNCNVEWCLKTKRLYDAYANKKGGIKVGKMRKPRYNEL
jgi:hypothetical protein